MAQVKHTFSDSYGGGFSTHSMDRYQDMSLWDGLTSSPVLQQTSDGGAGDAENFDNQRVRCFAYATIPEILTFLTPGCYQ